MFTEFHCFILFQTLDSKELYIKTRKQDSWVSGPWDTIFRILQGSPRARPV